MLITLILMIPITAMVVGFLVLKSVQLGLRWQFEMTHEQKPTMESVAKPIIQKFEQKQQEQFAQEQVNILTEYLHGPQDEKR